MERIERDRLLNQRQPLAIAVYESENIRKRSIALWIGALLPGRGSAAAGVSASNWPS
jgi:hypothetical protein